MSTSIEWTDETWNPVVGCSPASPGCDNCYAAVVASRQMQPAHEGLTIGRKWNGTVRLLPERLNEPLRWRKPRRVFVGSMTDLFHPDVPDGFIGSVFNAMALAPQHTFQVLTKRPQRMAALMRVWYAAGVFRDHRLRWVEPASLPLPNVWLGTSIESDAYTWRANHLRDSPAAVRFLSCEPLLGPLPSLDLTGIDWVIVGGESGPGARPMHPDWVRGIHHQTLMHEREAGRQVAFLFKQWGEWAPGGHPTKDSRAVDFHGRWQDLDVDGSVMVHRAGKKAAGRVLDGRTWDEFPGGAA